MLRGPVADAMRRDILYRGGWQQLSPNVLVLHYPDEKHCCGGVHKYRMGGEDSAPVSLAELSQDELLCEIIYPFGRVTPWHVCIVCGCPRHTPSTHHRLLALRSCFSSSPLRRWNAEATGIVCIYATRGIYISSHSSCAAVVLVLVPRMLSRGIIFNIHSSAPHPWVHIKYCRWWWGWLMWSCPT